MRPVSPRSDPTPAAFLTLSAETSAAIASADTSTTDRDAFGGREIPTHYGYILALYMRARSTHAAIAEHLLPARMSLEAMILARSLFEDSVRLEQLSLVGEQRRGGLILGWVNRSLAEELHLLRNPDLAGMGDLSEQIAKYELQQHKLIGYADRHGYRLALFGDVRKLAKRLGREADVAGGMT
jgi:hypothetical protein